MLMPDPTAPPLFEPIAFRSIDLRSRIVMSPMCQYSSTDGFADDWHLVHLGSRAVGATALVLTEATAVTAEGRISPADLGIWKDEHVEPLRRCTRFIRGRHSASGIQLAHAGRKASTSPPWLGGYRVPPEDGGWQPVAPSPIPFRPDEPPPLELDRAGIASVVEAFRAAARRAVHAEFDVIEIHAAHGYLLHEFLSPLANRRTDDYGGSFENRIRLLIEVLQAVREEWPDDLPIFVRISATDWVEGGWDLDQSVELARRLASFDVDLIDCSSGGMVPGVRIPSTPGYQVDFAERIRRDAGVPTGAVGLITTADQANAIVAGGKADVVLLARQLLRDSYWPLRAARALGATAPWPAQYLRAAD
jgi:2,4-dienoyl-CoA reductase-like NADH-dependent reductase (Old Yellow Enzyme family)